MGYPGRQTAAPPDRRPRHEPGEHPSGPIGPFGPIRGGFDDEAEELYAAYGSALPAGQTPYGQALPAGNTPYGHELPGAAGRARHAASPEVPAPRNGSERPWPGNPPPPAGIPAPRQGRGRHASHRGDQDRWDGHGAGPGQSRRSPARGYPPLPGEPGPRYPRGQFSAWNEPAAPFAASSGPAALAAPRAASGRFPAAAPPSASDSFMAPAPTWADTGETGAPWLGRDGQGGVALAEPPGDLAWRSDEEVEELAARFADAVALVVDEPGVLGTAAGASRAETAGRDPWAPTAMPAGEELGPAAISTRAAAAQARKAARRRGRARRRVIVAGICLPAIAAVAALAYVHHPGRAAPRAAGRPSAHSAAAPARSPAQSLGPWQHIGTRAEDPVPLTPGQLFPATFTLDGAGYAKTAQAGSTDCASAVFGARLQAAVRKYGCSQVMRASYLSAGQKLMGTIGVLNLVDSADAAAVGKVTGSSEFIAQLTAPSGPTHNLAKGTGLEEAEVKGHYLILTWVEFTNLHTPSTAIQKAQLKAFSANLINQTANVSLTSRMVTGEPQVP